jgi:FkbM family methyltransferase
MSEHKLKTFDKQLETNGSIHSVMGKYGRTYYFRHDEYVGKSIFQYGEFSPEECTYLINLANIRKGTVLDIGANIGCISQALAVAGHRVWAWEPQPELYKLLVLNTMGLTVNLANCALGAKPGTAYMPLVDYSKPGNFGGLGLGSGKLPVEVQTLDTYCLDNISLIKIDVEGFEEEVLLGALDTIERNKPIIYLEADREQNLPKLRSLLDKIGYTYSEHKPPLFSKDNYFHNPKLIWDQPYVSLNWDCRPK